jgi:hypothetical protein
MIYFKILATSYTIVHRWENKVSIVVHRNQPRRHDLESMESLANSSRLVPQGASPPSLPFQQRKAFRDRNCQLE